MRALNMLRQSLPYRRECFSAGLRAAGCEVVDSLAKPKADDVLLIWNRYGRFEREANRFEAAGARVLVAENGFLGRDWLNGNWYALARSFHNGGGWWPVEPEHVPVSQQRWSKFKVDFKPWRQGGSEIVVLATRGIGPEGVREPNGWSQRVAEQVSKRTDRPVRIRRHPGIKPCVPLEEDLRNAHAVVTWGSGAALKALLWGIPVFHGFPKWIGARAAQLLDKRTDFEHPSMPSRLPMFRQLAWAMWTVEEIREGEPFRWLLK